jgi:hypothetical protein
MRILAKLSIIVPALLAAAPAYADYASIQHAFGSNGAMRFDHATGVLHVHVENNSPLILSDPAPLSGVASNIVLDLTTTLDHVDAEGIAHFWGGSLNLSFEFDPTGPAPPQTHQIGGPILTLLFEIGQVGQPSRIDGYGTWFATTIDLPGSNTWPNGGLASALDGFSIDFGEDLGDFQWDRSIQGPAELLYSLYPDASSLCCCAQDARFLVNYESTSRQLHIEKDTTTGWGHAFEAGQCFGTYALTLTLDSISSDGAAFFTGGTLSTGVGPDDSIQPPWTGSLQGDAVYLWLVQRTSGPVVELHGDGRWDPTTINVTVPWPGGSPACGFDGLSNLGIRLLAVDESSAPGTAWTADWSAIAFGADLDLAPQECPATICDYPFGDVDLDCDVDLHDFAAAMRCFGGNASITDKIACLRVLDANGDLTTKLDDFASWQMSGPLEAPTACCTTP